MRLCEREHADRGSLPDAELFQRFKSRTSTVLARGTLMAWHPFKRTSGDEGSHPMINSLKNEQGRGHGIRTIRPRKIRSPHFACGKFRPGRFALGTTEMKHHIFVEL